ncbi:hypothetical protein CFC21_020111 [Triticum aestivum]|uniref:GATA-type domain-containing protein n=2 Tax=Triticum aestivum TaxID=4565 RepID=A0A9R1E7G8_WHEAT|nr:GATA transcription factor 27-like isoform X1 [Triticum aestivum]KAF7004951.1 hypothetical protein CFC21_020111 [Triticum aestivum]
MVKVKKEGPCCHCRVMSSPLWRHGPPEKPVLCNACGTRWRKKGTLENYTPAPQVQRKQTVRRTVKKEPSSDNNLGKTGDAADTFSNPSGFGSALSYSGSAQSHAREPLVPSRKKSCVGRRRKPSTVEALAEDLNSIMHEEQLCSGSGLGTIPGSSDEDLLIYHSETPASCFEIGYGSMLLRHPNSESEANSVPAHNKKVGGRGNAGGAFRGLTKSTMRSLKRLYESQPQIFTDAEVRGGTMHKPSFQFRMPKSGNATGGVAAAAFNLFMLPPDKLSSMLVPPEKGGDQDSLLLEVPRNALHPEAELLLSCPPSCR